MQKKVLTTYQIAKYCGVSPRTISQWINEGKIRAYKTPGNHSRVNYEDCIYFLKEYNMPIPRELELNENSTQKKKILIVDDDKNMARSIERIPELRQDYELAMAFDGFDAGRALSQFCPDLVILDIKMPGMDGYEVAKRIKDMPELVGVKIIAISAFFESEGKEKMINLGASVCIDKPFNQKQLLGEINKIFKENKKD